MSSSLDFYRERAAEARREAEAAKLANVRERCLRSAEAWEVMVMRAARMERMRAEHEAAKAAAAESMAAA